MKFIDQAKIAFSHRKPPPKLAEGIRTASIELTQISKFEHREWYDIKWDEWQENPDTISMFKPEAFAYFLPSVMVLTFNESRWLRVADFIVMMMDLSPIKENWDTFFLERFSILSKAELGIVSKWLLSLTDTDYNKPFDRVSRAFDVVEILKKDLA